MAAVTAFYFFAIVVVVSGFLVVTARNPVHSVLWLILAFFASAGLFVLLGAEFVAMIMLIVYVGAVAVLFLFVVMMLDIDFAALKGKTQFLPIGGVFGVLLLVLLGYAFGAWEVTEETLALRGVPAPSPVEVENTVALGTVLYTRYIYAFQMAGVVLLVAMIGAIVLTLRKRAGVKRQDVRVQVHRDPKTAVALKDVKPGQGL